MAEVIEDKIIIQGIVHKQIFSSTRITWRFIRVKMCPSALLWISPALSQEWMCALNHK